VVVPGLVVHVDAALLTGDDPDGRCHLEDGPALPESVLRRIGCDTQMVAITERDGLPIDVGRARYIVPTPLRRAIQARAGATIGRAAGPTFWGGHSGILIDPDGHPWEVAHNPGFHLSEDGSVQLERPSS
jgi:hypothetical protein